MQSKQFVSLHCKHSPAEKLTPEGHDVHTVGEVAEQVLQLAEQGTQADDWSAYPDLQTEHEVVDVQVEQPEGQMID